jgi:menaquinone-dependent protoporphyrinogen oxidase
MKIAILYGSKYGATESCARKIASEIRGEVELINLLEKKPQRLIGYDAVLMGGAVYAGKMADDVIHGIKNLNFGDTPYGLFICCKDEKEKAEGYLRLNLGDGIVDNAMLIEHLGHGINLDRMNFFTRTAMKTMFKIKKSYTEFNSAAIHRVADGVNRMEIVHEQ